MKKIILIICLTILCGCQKEIINFKYTDYYEYMIDNVNEIEKVTMTTVTELGKMCYDVTNYKEIVYDSIINTVIIKESNIRTTDDDLSYTFNFNDGTIVSYSYEGRNLIYNNKQYEIESYYKISPNDLEGQEIDCSIK